jgi:hypothetical protein
MLVACPWQIHPSPSSSVTSTSSPISSSPHSPIIHRRVANNTGGSPASIAATAAALSTAATADPALLAAATAADVHPSLFYYASFAPVDGTSPKGCVDLRHGATLKELPPQMQSGREGFAAAFTLTPTPAPATAQDPQQASSPREYILWAPDVEARARWIEAIQSVLPRPTAALATPAVTATPATASPATNQPSATDKVSLHGEPGVVTFHAESEVESQYALVI